MLSILISVLGTTLMAHKSKQLLAQSNAKLIGNSFGWDFDLPKAVDFSVIK
jgi:hypothetical protein